MLTHIPDHEIFRLHDEVQLHEGKDTTFYDFIGLKNGPSASQSDITKAYKKRSVRMHPDKHKPKPPPGVTYTPTQLAELHKQASERFARFRLVVAVLTGPGRERYDHFLKNGFPRWRGTGYYYSRFRPGLGSVLAGLFLFSGAMHYGILWLNAKRQREFMHRYIKDARVAAWGKGGIPGLNVVLEAAATSSGSENTATEQKLNRAERRAGKGKAVKETSRSGSATPSIQNTTKRRVVADNGKVLMVDSAGAVYLVDQDENAKDVHFMLDVDEIEGPKIKNTLLVTLPLWIFNKTIGRLIPGRNAAANRGEVYDSEEDIEDEEDVVTSSAGEEVVVKKMAKKKGVAKKVERSDGLPRRKAATKRPAKK
ncbi:hypothetical protein L873DRAFT_242738 [Choiromyces venosus 120613-1]|uniref:J domain-containing protein n=1 Tax=Choiromyces venosus 120613-1 TaxID=1336337 RepID=A0A3N4J647_9PEZI|nr:hypothetical protein L873DRAFT_242738 [Choiromyces venosus 120613-1]